MLPTPQKNRNQLSSVSALRAPKSAILGIGSLACFCIWSAARAAPPPASETPAETFQNAFFAFDNGTGRDEWSPEQQAQLLDGLGYAGIGYTGTQKIPEMLTALDRHHLKMFSIYVAARVGAKGASLDPHLADACRALQGRETIIWLTVQGKMDDDDRQAVTIVRQAADLADRFGLRVALYPHYGFYVGTVDKALHIAEKVKRKNLGVSFNLCHWLRGEQSRPLSELLPRAAPHLMLVSVNGADQQGGWPELIQTLDRGEYDVLPLLVQLKRLGYDGPIGLQCYNVQGDRRENLRRSAAAWNALLSRLNGAGEPK